MITTEFFLENPELCMCECPEEVSDLIKRCIFRIQNSDFQRRNVVQIKHPTFKKSGEVNFQKATEEDALALRQALQAIKKFVEVTGCQKLMLFQ